MSDYRLRQQYWPDVSLHVRQVLNGLCEHVSSASVFVSTNSHQICHASTLEKKRLSHKHLIIFLPAGISLLSKSRFVPSNLADTSKTGQQM